MLARPLFCITLDKHNTEYTRAADDSAGFNVNKKTSGGTQCLHQEASEIQLAQFANFIFPSRLQT